MAYVVRSTKSSDDFTGSPGRKTRSVSVSDVSPVMVSPTEAQTYRTATARYRRRSLCYRIRATCVDAFTKWAEAFPLRSKEAEAIAKVLVEQVFCRFGTPVSLLSDQGKEVDKNIMKHVCRLLGIDKLRTTPYKP